MSRILTLDIEMSPIKGYVWSAWQQNMLPDRIVEPPRMISWAAKWLGEKKSKIVYQEFRDDDFLGGLYHLLDKADMVVGYNQDKFDLRHIHREFVGAGYPPPRPTASVDMLKVVKQRFLFPHNRLDYVAEVVLGETKLETGGFGLWPAFLGGEPKALKLMQKYNKQDVFLTEKLYKKLRPWVRNHPYLPVASEVYINDSQQNYECPVCHSENVRRTRPRMTRCMAIRVLGCQDCGHWFDGKRTKVTP